VGLFAVGVVLYGGSSALYLTHAWSWVPATIINGLAAYWCFFTVWHEASHRTISTSDAVNAWLGRLAFFLVVPWGGSRFLRWVHMQHHLFTGIEGLDPDYGVSHGRWWTTPLRWALLDVIAAGGVVPKLRSRPRGDQIEQLLTIVAFAGLAGAMIATGNGVALLVLVIVPCRLSLLQMGLIFDWLPHHGLSATTNPPDQFEGTRNRIGWEWLMTPITQYQNYHLVHHLHPRIPYYRYLTVWRRNERAYLEHQPSMRSWTGHPITTAEYERSRTLEVHD
jgi:ring-1,2-phenylacetyl-CoA epoxidase subunit PaaE